MKKDLLLLILLLPLGLFSQNPLPQGYFRSPVDFPLSLSGSYGEIRQNHFHSGIDIRTGGAVDKPVYAVADGYVCRVFVSPYGFGKALYIQHANGYTSVYGHLNKFNTVIGKWVRDEQYQKESFSLDAEVPAGLLKVRKGDIIAYSGNSGSSAGPHLHFEIRDGATQDPLDPLAFGIPIADRTRPVIYNVRIIPSGATGMVNFADRPMLLPVTGSGGSYVLKPADTVMVSGNIIFGIEAFDFHDGTTMKNGIRRFELWVDGEQRFGMTIDRFAFSDTRYVNSILDYPLYVQAKRRVVKFYKAPNNKLDLFDDPSASGEIHFTDRQIHKIRFVVKDVHGNTSSVTFPVLSHPPANAGGRFDPSFTAKGTWLRCTEPNHYDADGIRFTVPGEALYEDLDFIYDVKPAVSGRFSSLHRLHDRETPLHTWCELSIRTDGLPAGLREKALIVRVDESGKYISAGGTYEDGWVKSRIREFGDYTILVDTMAPVIRPVNVTPGKVVSKQGTITLKISDDLSGIRTYRGTLNGQWILMDYDAKRNLLTYKFDDRIKTGKNLFRLVVTDDAGNRSEYEAGLTK